MQTQINAEIAAPYGLVRNRVVADPTGSVRVCLSVSVLRRGGDWRPGVVEPQHVAFATGDALAAAAAAREAGAPLLRGARTTTTTTSTPGSRCRPDRLAPDARARRALRRTGRDGNYLHFYTEVLGGRVFFEVVQRTSRYAGYGEVNGPIRMAAHRAQRRSGDALLSATQSEQTVRASE